MNLAGFNDWEYIDLDYPPTFVESAVFADKILYRKGGWAFQRTWHYVNIPYTPDVSENGNPMPFKSTEDWDDKHDIVDVINDLVAFLGEREENSTSYQKILTYFDGDDEIVSLAEEKQIESFVLRLLIHYVGDIHQPCHTFQRFDAADPKGDKGCNRFKIATRNPNFTTGSAKNLHAAWDGAVYQWHRRLKLPVSESEWIKFTRDLYNPDNGVYGELDKNTFNQGTPKSWSEEGEAFAEDIYGDLVEGDPLPKEYVEHFQPIGSQRMALAGSRLANLIAEFYKKEGDPGSCDSPATKFREEERRMLTDDFLQ